MKSKKILQIMLIAAIFSNFQIINCSAGSGKTDKKYLALEKLYPDFSVEDLNQLFSDYHRMIDNWASAGSQPTFKEYINRIRQKQSSQINQSTSALISQQLLSDSSNSSMSAATLSNIAAQTAPFNDQATQDLFKAINNQDITKAQQAINYRADVNYVNQNGKNPLWLAVSKNYLTMVQFLLMHGAQQSIDIINTYYDSILNFAVELSINDDLKKDINASIIKLLLENGAQKYINIANKYGYTPLYYAAKRNKLKAVKLLLENDVRESINVMYGDGYKPLHWAAQNNNLEMVHLLLENGATQSINFYHEFSHTPLYIAVSNNNLPMVKLLLENGAQQSINIANQTGSTPLHLAVFNNNLVMVALLIDNGAQIIDDNPLYIAIKSGYLDILEILLTAHINNSKIVLDILHQLTEDFQYIPELTDPQRSQIIKILEDYINPGLK